MSSDDKRPWCTGCGEWVPAIDERELCAECVLKPVVKALSPGRREWMWVLKSRAAVCAGCGEWFYIDTHNRYTRRCVGCFELGGAGKALKLAGIKSQTLYSRLRYDRLLPEDIAHISYRNRAVMRGIGPKSIDMLNQLIPYVPEPVEQKGWNEIRLTLTDVEAEWLSAVLGLVQRMARKWDDRMATDTANAVWAKISMATGRGDVQDSSH